MRWLIIVALVLLAVAPARAGDAKTLAVDGKVFRLDGIDAPESDQVCLNDGGEVFPCGRAAAAALAKFIADRPVYCTDLGVDPSYAKRRLGQCFVDGVDLGPWLVEKGWGLNLEPRAKGRFAAEEADARAGRLGLWNGCFVAPLEFRKWRKSGAALLGASCPPDTRDKLFADEAVKPAGFEVKGHYAIRALPYEGIYHLPDCGSYRRTKAKRWFRDEAAAIAAGFRKSYTCGWW